MLSILGFIAIFIAAYFVYKTARDTNRNAFGWAFLTIAAGIGLQIFLPIIIFFTIALGMAVAGKPLTSADDLPLGTTSIVGILGLAASIGGVWLIMRHVSELPEDETVIVSPPPAFDEKN